MPIAGTSRAAASCLELDSGLPAVTASQYLSICLKEKGREKEKEKEKRRKMRRSRRRGRGRIMIRIMRRG